MVAGALWREERQRDLLAWHVMHVVAGSGAKKRGGGQWRMQDFLGRDPVSLLSTRPGELLIDAPAPPSPEPAAPAVTPARTASPLTMHLESLAARGFQVTRVE